MDAASNIADQTYSRAKSIAMQFAIFIFMLLSLSAECLCDNTRKSIAIADLNFTGIEISQKESFIDALTTKLHSSSVYAVIERSQINQILREQAFQQSGVCDQPKCAIELGKLLGANKLIFGSVGLISNQAFANLRIVDVETGSIDKSYSNLRKGDFSELMSEIASDAAGELTGLASKSDVIGTNLVDRRDGKIYHTFKFQKKVWMAENLNYS